MSKVASEVAFGSQSTYIYGTDPYDSTKVGLGPHIRQTNGGSADANYVSPWPIGFAHPNPVETGGAVPAQFPAIVNFTSTIDWVFFCDQAAGAATRRVILFEYNRTTSTFTYKGYVTLSFPFLATQGVYVVRGFKVVYDKYTTGTAAASGTGVTGTLTAWDASRLCVGSRIGFGSVDPSAISTWYEIQAIGGDGSITLTSSAGTIPDGPYVIEELSIVHLVTNGTTATNGGVFLAKGLRYEIFNGGGTAVPAAAAADRVRANFWLADAATETNTVGIGCDIIKTNWTTQHLYALDTVANPIMFKYNLRANLLPTLAAGRTTDAFMFKSGSHGALASNASQNNNFVIATTSHGTGSGLSCGYFVSTGASNRFYRTADVTTIVAASTTWAGTSSPETPPDSTNAFAATTSLNSLAYSSVLDMFLVSTGNRMYCTHYPDSAQWDRLFLSDNKQTLQSSTSPYADFQPFPSFTLGTFFIQESNGILYMAQTGLTAATNFVYAFPVQADWEYTSRTKNVVILPAVSTLNVSSYIRAYVARKALFGSSTGFNVGVQSEPVRISYRTTGITDDSGAWTLLGPSGDMSAVNPATSVQLKLEFKIFGLTCISSQVMACGFIYEDLSTDSHYQPSIGNSSLANKRFAWRFSTAFGGTVPRLKVRLYDAVSPYALLVTDDTTSTPLAWEQSTDGGTTWVPWTNADKGNEITYLRYTPVSLGDNIRVRSLLTLY